MYCTMKEQIQYVEMQREVGVLKSHSIPLKNWDRDKNADYILKFIFVNVNC